LVNIVDNISAEVTKLVDALPSNLVSEINEVASGLAASNANLQANLLIDASEIAQGLGETGNVSSDLSQYVNDLVSVVTGVFSESTQASVNLTAVVDEIISEFTGVLGEL